MIHRFVLWSAIVLVATSPVLARPPVPKPPKPKLIQDNWDAAYLEGVRTGFVHTTLEEIQRDGHKFLRSTLRMDLKIKRYDSVVALRMETGDEETPEGKVVSMSLTQFLDKGQITQTGTVEDGQLVVRSGGRELKTVPWDDSVIGIYRQDQLFKDQKLKPGDHFTFRSYELSLLSPVTVRVDVKEPQEVDVFEIKGEGDKQRAERATRRLVRIVGVPEKVEVNGTPLQLPRQVVWLDKNKEVARSEMELPGLGKITLYRTTRAAAEQEGATPALLPDLGLTSLIPLNKRIENVHEARSVVYKVTTQEEDDPSTIFARDGRQSVKNAKGNSFELDVHRQSPPAADAKPEQPGKEFLDPSYFLDSNNPKIHDLAAQIVADQTDPWLKAVAIEKWVHNHMKSSSAVGFATASQICKDLTGDCRQHAMLTAALCRAAGIPARTALGLVYFEDADKGPALGFHMWTEVWVKGQWLGLDATLGRGSIGPGHLKIADHSWHDVQTLAPLLPVVRVMGKTKIEVLRVEQRQGEN